ncbi:MAG: DNA-binding MarR family transcriptional regulator [Myxococcota bacterium]|jgi:DNA-binding MarR family transcriptional regulator
MDAEARAELEALKRQSVLQVLFKVARLLSEQAIGRAREASGHALRPAHTSLFPHLEFEGQRLTALAARVGVSKQAIKPLVDELEAWGMVERVPDPSDGRAKLIRLSTTGGEAMVHGVGLLRALEAELAERVGEDSMEQLHHILLELLGGLDGSRPDAA